MYEACWSQSNPAAAQPWTDCAVRACTVHFRPSRWVSDAMSVNSSSVKAMPSTGPAVTAESFDPETLMTSTPSFTCRRISSTISSRLLTSTPAWPLGNSIQLGKASSRPWRLVICRPAAAIRGPSTIPASMASRRHAEMLNVVAGSERLVTPARRTLRTFHAASIERYSTGV